MGSSFKFNCVLILFIFCCELVGGITVTTDPQAIVVREGRTATLGCTVEGKSPRDKIRWYRFVDNALVPISKESAIEPEANPATGEYRVVGVQRRGEYNLEITDTNRRDSGEYRCGYRKGGRDITSSVELQVVVPPNITSPICQMMSVDDDASSSVPGFFRVGDTVRLLCSSSGGIPPASLRWKPGRTVLTPNTPGRVRIEWDIQQEDIGQEFTCYAESPALDGPRVCTLIPANNLLRVRIMPDSVALTVDGGTTFSCAADDAPPESTFMWLLNGNEILNNGRERFEIAPDTRSLTMRRIRNSDNGAKLACELRLQDGVLGRAEATIDVIGVQNYTPDPTSTAQPMTSRVSTMLLPSMSLSVSPTEVRNASGTDDTTHMSMELIIVSAVAGLAVGALAIILIIYIVKRQRKRKATRQNQNPRESTPGSKPTVLPMKQQPGTPNGVQISEDGYTTLALRRPNMSCSDYETVEHGAFPSAPAMEQGDGEMCWDYEIPYSKEHSKRPPMVVANNPVYLDITG